MSGLTQFFINQSSFSAENRCNFLNWTFVAVVRVVFIEILLDWPDLEVCSKGADFLIKLKLEIGLVDRLDSRRQLG